jgi:5-methylcytosine-specific restriction enzyme subunit McrC
VLKAAIRLLLKVSKELKNQRQLAELLLVFEGASDCTRASLPWHRVVFDRMSDRYKPCFKLAELFLKKTPPDVSGGGVQGFSLFFDMNVLFEEYIGRIAARVFRSLGYQVTLQSPQKYLACDENQNLTPAFLMKPDVVGQLNSQTAWIVDTKWKFLTKENQQNSDSTKKKDAVTPADFYQMYAYANRYECPDVVLLYPHSQELGLAAGVRGNYLLNSWRQEDSKSENKRVRVATIDLSDLKTVPDQLKKIIRGIKIDLPFPLPPNLA